jgi:hypothetical protein
VILTFPGQHRPKNSARVPAEERQAGDQSKQAHFNRDELDSAIGECRMLKLLQQRLARFNAYLYPLCGDALLISQPDGFTRRVPDLRSARELLKQWEAR